MVSMNFRYYVIIWLYKIEIQNLWRNEKQKYDLTLLLTVIQKLMSFWESYIKKRHYLTCRGILPKRGREKYRQKTKAVWSPSPTTWVVPCGSGGDDELATLLTFKILRGGWARALITIIMGVGVQARNHGPSDTR